MSYLEEFQYQLQKQEISRVLQLWEEYCTAEEVNAAELEAILQTVKESDAAQSLGPCVELALPMWSEIEEQERSYNVIKLILDLQSTDSQQLGDTAYEVLRSRYGDQTYFNEKIRLIGLRNRESFPAAISNYELLTHLDKGKFVFHTGGWGTGEIMDYSIVREELILEFEYVVGQREFSFENAFKHLIPLPSNHFLSRRFGDPDTLEEHGRKDPAGLARLLLRDLGPKTAAEIKEELCELVIPEDDWSKWWQSARAKLKKDTQIESPSSIRQPFRLREKELSHEDRFQLAIDAARVPGKKIQTIYNFVRDFPEILKSENTRELLKKSFEDILQDEDRLPSQELQVFFFQEQLFPKEPVNGSVQEFILKVESCRQLIDEIEIVAFKKRALVAIREYRSDWLENFKSLILEMSQSPLREYMLKELNSPDYRDELKQVIHHLLHEPTKHPEAFIWYFQKLMSDGDLPYSDSDGKCEFFEALLILLNVIERDPANRDLVKKIVGMITNKRFEMVRQILEETAIEYAQEFLLLVTKCHSLTDREIKILHSLAEVVHPSLGDSKESEEEEDQTIWTTQEGYEKLKEKIHHIGTVETVENAKEIEEARAHGDLRENSEYKFALEKRARLQGQLKLFSDQLNKARILTKQDIHLDSIGVGSRVQLEDGNGGKVTYTLLGPWDADVEANILSFQSKLAKDMSGHKVGDTLELKGENYTVKSIERYLG